MKNCFSCKNSKDVSEFNKDKSRCDGLNTSCRQCTLEKAHKYKAKREGKEYKAIESWLNIAPPKICDCGDRPYYVQRENPCVHK